DYFLDLKHGNPYDKIPEAEIRLPGAGYAALHKDVAGLDPEKYPLAHRVKILGDVAMWSSEYRSAMSQAKRGIKTMSTADAYLVTETDRQVKEKKKRREFQNYVFAEDQLAKQKVTISKVLSPTTMLTEELGDLILEVPGMGAIKDKDAAMAFAEKTMLGKQVDIQTPSLESRRYTQRAAGPIMKAMPTFDGTSFSELMAEEGLAGAPELKDEFKQLQFSKAERLAGGLSEMLLHGAETPLEYLTPVSPASKLIRRRSP
ncbi:unnamed protein product, partial [marine sediment metagenome]